METEQRSFLSSSKPHILMITNHGIHEWKVIPGLRDTGGQNVFVNQFTDVLARMGFRITIANRGGYRHPESGGWQRGLSYKDGSRRILYLEDRRPGFIRKEDMHEHIPRLVDFLEHRFEEEGTRIDLILSHYWDAAAIGVQYNRGLRRAVKHIWIPHSLGTIKKRNVPIEQWPMLRIDERIAVEQELIAQLDGIAATSSLIRRALKEDYGYIGPDLFLPPCVNPRRFHPRSLPSNAEIWKYLSKTADISQKELRNCRIVTEISRTDTTKAKDVLIKAFAEAHRRVPESFLVVSIDESREELASELKSLISSSGIQDRTATVGSIWDLLPSLYAATDIYCTPAVQEGFGMSAQEAAATAVPVVASDRVPFVEEYLLGPQTEEISSDKSRAIRLGKGAIQVSAGDVDGFAKALQILLIDESQRRRMGQNAYHATVPFFTWDNMTRRFLDSIGIEASGLNRE